MHLKHKTNLGLALLVAGGLLSAATAHAQTVTATQTAWYSDTGLNNTGPGNYIAGLSNGRIFHDYFTFNLSGLSGQSITGATLDLYQPISPPNNGNGIVTALTFALGSVSTDPTTVDTTANSVAIFNALASGVLYGSYALDPSQVGRTLHLNLDAAALADITSRRGLLFTIGGYVPANNSYTFAATNNGTTGSTATPTPTLTLITAPVPEASTTVSFGLLLALGMGGLVVAARRKKAA